MKKLILLAFAGLFAGYLLNAQPENRPPRMTIQERFDQEMTMFKEELKINQDQEKKITAINDKFKPELEAARNLERGERWQKTRELTDKRVSEIETVLTAEQKAKFQKIREEQRQEMQRRRGNGPPQGE